MPHTRVLSNAHEINNFIFITVLSVHLPSLFHFKLKLKALDGQGLFRPQTCYCNFLSQIISHRTYSNQTYSSQ